MKIYRILLILVATIISLATIGQSWDVHQAIQQGRAKLESKGKFDLSEDQWNDNGDRYILSNSMKSIYFIGSTYIDFSYVLISDKSGLHYFVVEDSLSPKLNPHIEEAELANNPNVYIDFSRDYWMFVPLRIEYGLIAANETCRYHQFEEVANAFDNFYKFELKTKPRFYYVCLVSGYAIEKTYHLKHVDFNIPHEPHKKPDFVNHMSYFRAVIAMD